MERPDAATYSNNWVPAESYDDHLFFAAYEELLPRPSADEKERRGKDAQKRQPGEKPAEKPEDKPAGTGDEPAEKSEDKPAGTGDEPAEKAEDKPAETGDKPGEKAEDKPAGTGDEPAEKAEDKPAETGDGPGEKAEDKPAGTGENPVEKAEDQPAETADKPVEKPEDQPADKPADDPKPIDQSHFRLNAPPVVSEEATILDQFGTVEIVEGPMVPQETIASRRADAYMKFANAADNNERLSAGLQYKVLVENTSTGTRLSARDRENSKQVSDWLKNQGEHAAYSKCYLASRDPNLRPVEKYAQALEYVQFVNSVYGDDASLSANPKVKERFELTSQWVRHLAQNSRVGVDLDAIRAQNNSQITHEAIAKSVAHQLGFRDEDMASFGRACNMDVIHAFARPIDSTMSDQQWLESLKDQKTVNIWEMQSGQFNNMRAWAKMARKIAQELPAAEAALEKRRDELSREEYQREREALNKLRAKAEGREPMFEAPKGDERIREFAAAVSDHCDIMTATILKPIDIATRPLQATSTFLAGSMLVIGDTVNSDWELTKYHVTNLPDAVWQRFHDGTTMKGFEQPVTQLYTLSVDGMGYDKNSSFNRGVRGLLEVVGDPTTYATPQMVFGKLSSAGRVAALSNEVPIIARATSEGGETVASLSRRLAQAYGEAPTLSEALAADLATHPMRARVTATGIVLDEDATRLAMAKMNEFGDDAIPVIIDGRRTTLSEARFAYLNKADADPTKLTPRAVDPYRHEPLNPMEQTRFETLGKKHLELGTLPPEEAQEFRNLALRTRGRGPVGINAETAAKLQYESNPRFHSDATYEPVNYRDSVGDMSRFDTTDGAAFKRAKDDFSVQKTGSENWQPDPALTKEENIARFNTDHIEVVSKDVRTYQLKGTKATINVPEEFAAKLDEVRELRLQAKNAPTAAERQQAVDAVNAHPMKDALLPEELAAIIDRLPNKDKLTKVQIYDTADPLDLARGNTALAAAHPESGSMFFYESAGRSDAVWVSHHEWAHLTQEGATLNHFTAFKEAEAIEAGGLHLRGYAKTNPQEDLAVHLGEAFLAPDAAEFKFVADRAPLRTVCMSDVLRSELETAKAAGKAPQQIEQLMRRIDYVDNVVAPQAQEELRAMMASGDIQKQTQAVDFLNRLALANPKLAAKLTHTQELTKLIAATDDGSLAYKAGSLVRENLKNFPDDALRVFTDVAKDGNTRLARDWALDSLGWYPSAEARFAYLDLQRNLHGPGSFYWLDDVARATQGVDDVAAMAVFEHGYKLTEPGMRAKLIADLMESVRPELLERMKQRAAVIDAQ
ncbi:MAG TPA: hypothetical protein V6D17_05700 [Candidatus Obscuribacterales bacterium]